jgi:hypothetical protein
MYGFSAQPQPGQYKLFPKCPRVQCMFLRKYYCEIKEGMRLYDVKPEAYLSHKNRYVQSTVPRGKKSAGYFIRVY